MQKIFTLLLAMFLIQTARAQYTIKIVVKDQDTEAAIVNANITACKNNINAITDATGAALLHLQYLPDTISISHTGYLSQFIPISTFTDTTYYTVLLKVQEAEMEAITVQSTRTGRTIANTPTRIELIDGEELDEKINMRPANVAMLLHESTGIQVQQTSATSGASSIRIQGLDGRYTQLLKDGYASFGNFASGLSILEIPPMDLKQVEVIKGPASTLYGGGAIAGVVNFISKTPTEALEGDLLLNQSNIGQTNAGAYFSKRNKKFGYAVLGLFNLQKAYDVDEDDFSELPKNNSFTLHPRLFFYINESTTITAGNSLTSGKSTGGDMHVIKGESSADHVYFEKNNTLRNTATLELDKKFSGRNAFKLKQSLSVFNRDIAVPQYTFSGKNLNSFTDLSYTFFSGAHTMIGGANFIYDQFKQNETGIQNNRSATGGLYFQDTWDMTGSIKLESGLRADHVHYNNINFAKSQTFVLPRISALFKLSDKFSSRIGGGLGYKIPTIFTERTESMQYQNVLPLDNTKAEKSIGGTADINYRNKIREAFQLSLNQMFFYTSISRPLVLEQDAREQYYFINAGQPVVSRGFETNLRLIYMDNLKFFLGYTFTDAKANYLQSNRILPLMPRHKLNNVLMYEKEGNFKLGLEGYYTGNQYLYNGTPTPSFWEFGFMAQKTFNKIDVYINFENFTDERQSKYKRVVNGSSANPVFDDIWNHTEGRAINGGVKIRI
ncbi:MAG: TonB-dependent receptor plug domain-containing protein [Niabella sp.]